MGFLFQKKKYVGIDIGTSSIKIAELEKSGTRAQLVNYVTADSPILGSNITEIRKSFLQSSSGVLVDILQQVFKMSGIKAKKIAISIPVYSAFTTVFDSHVTSAEGAESIIRNEAQKHVPLKLSEVVLEWRIVGGGQDKEGNSAGSKVFIMAVPNDIVKRYREISQQLGVELEVLEVEIFSIARSAFGTDQNAYMLIDIGGQNTNLTIFAQGFIRNSVNFNIAGDDFNRAIINKYSKWSTAQAEEVKHAEGLSNSVVKSALTPLLDSIIHRAQTMLDEEKESGIKKVIVSGGSMLMPGILNYFQSNLELPIELVDPWKSVGLPRELQSSALNLGTSFAVAIGLALRGLDN